MVFTTNKPIEEWGRVLHDPDLAEAILDRVLERGRVLHFKGPSFRTRHLRGQGVPIVSGKMAAEFQERTNPPPGWPCPSTCRPAKRVGVARFRECGFGPKGPA
ncbi:MAG: ATP-binding protein [Thermoplasmata archaeon]